MFEIAHAEEYGGKLQGIVMLYATATATSLSKRFPPPVSDPFVAAFIETHLCEFGAFVAIKLLQIQMEAGNKEFYEAMQRGFFRAVQAAVRRGHDEGIARARRLLASAPSALRASAEAHLLALKERPAGTEFCAAYVDEPTPDPFLVVVEQIRRDAYSGATSPALAKGIREYVDDFFQRLAVFIRDPSTWRP